LLVLNGSGIANAEGAKANELRGLNYPIAGTGIAPSRTATTVACLAGFEPAGEDLALALGPSTAVTAYPNPTPEGSENADCIVTLGR
jgi:hypothetical protein